MTALPPPVTALPPPVTALPRTAPAPAPTTRAAAPRRSLRVALGCGLIGLGAILAGCPSDEGPAPAGGDDTSTATTAGTTTTAAAIPQPGFGSPDCDTWLARMRKCIEGAPQEERAARSKSVDETESMWKSQSGTPEGQKRLATACKAAVAQLDKDGVCAAIK